MKSQDSVNQLLTDKIRHYEKLAAALINDDSSTQSKDAVWSNARTPITVNGPSVESRDTAHTVGENSCSCTDFVFLNNTASQANTKLARALDLDESGKYDAAVAAYVEASESLLVALKAADKLSHLGHTGAQGVASVLKRRMTQTLDRVELLKKMKQNKVVNRQRIL